MKNNLARVLFAATLLIAPIAHADNIESSPQIPGNSNAATPNLSGVKCVLRAEKGQGKFRQGETIRLIASFTSDRPGYKINRLVRNVRGMATLGAVKVSPAANVTDPFGEVPLLNVFAINGFVPPPVALGVNPVEFPFILNNWARFDKPGIYQITLTTARVFVAKPDDRKIGVNLLFNSSSNAQITSEPLQIEITPADDAWANQQVELWRAYWQKNANLPSYRKNEFPSNDISFLGTRAAMTAIIEHLGQNTRPNSSHDDTYLFRTGFIGFADRDWLIGAMKRAIEEPNYAVTQGFFGLLVELQSLQNMSRPSGADATRLQYDEGANGQSLARQPTPAQQLQLDWEKRRADARDAAWLLDWQQTASAVERKTGAARALTLHSLLELAWNNNRENGMTVKAKLPRLVAQLAPIFDQLPPSPQLSLLGYEWGNIQSPAFAPALERLWKAPVDKNDYYQREVADLTLQRLYELDPKRNRALIIEQIKATKPRVSIKALRILPDETLPGLDAMLAAKFENYRNEDLSLSTLLIERYASAAALPRIKAEFERSIDEISGETLAGLLAYFVRVNPGYSVPKLAEKLRIWRTSQNSDLLFDVASRQFNPQIEQVAIDSLNNAGEGVAIDAARTLARFGSPAARDALMNRLKSTSDSAYPKVRARIETRIVVALADAQGWLSPPAQLEQIRALCQTDDGRLVADNHLRTRTQNADKPIWVS